jgi:hypothetical protein
MTFKIAQAARENVKLKIGISGPSGSGKTFSALELAYGIAGSWEKIGVVDTENRSALYYASKGPWRHIPFDPNEHAGAYHPRNYVNVIRFAEQQDISVLVIDSISHEWEGKGGCLDLVDQSGKGFTSWKTVTPQHNAFMDAMRLSPLHIIATMRSKQDYVVEQNDRGKSAPKKVGMKVIQREGADYDFGIVFDVDMAHMSKSSKDRTGLFMPRGEFPMTVLEGKELLEWSNSGIERQVPVSAPKPVKAKPATGYDPDNGEHLQGMESELEKRKIDRHHWLAISEAMRGKSSTHLWSVITEVIHKAEQAEADAALGPPEGVP